MRISKLNLNKVCYMLRVNPEEGIKVLINIIVSQNIMKIGTVGLPKILNFEDIKYRPKGMFPFKILRISSCFIS